MSDATAPGTVTPVTPAPAMDPVTQKLTELGITADAIVKIKALGADTLADLAQLRESDLAGILPTLKARKLLAAVAPAAAPAVAPAATPTVPTYAAPAPTGDPMMTNFAMTIGANPMMLAAFMNGNGGDGLSLSSLMSIPALIAGYNPKVRDPFFDLMGQVQRHLDNVPIIVCNPDGSINKPFTISYIEGLQEGMEPYEDDVYLDEAGNPYQIVNVGVDLQSVYDADPLNSSKALQKTGQGLGRISWKGVSLDVRQVVFLAVTKTGEIDPKNDAHLTWLRDNIKPDMFVLALRRQMPKAMTAYNEGLRTGQLPMLRVTLALQPRRPETGPRRVRTEPKALTGVGQLQNEDPPPPRGGFPFHGNGRG